MSDRSRQPASLLLCFLLLVATGCYSYSPVENRSVEAGDEVRIRVSEEGREDPRVYTGRVTRLASDSLVLSVPVARTPGQATTRRDRGRTVSIPADRVSGVERQEFSFWKSAGLIAAGGAASSLLLAELAGTTDQSDRSSGDEDSGEFVVIPIP